MTEEEIEALTHCPLCSRVLESAYMGGYTEDGVWIAGRVLDCECGWHPVEGVFPRERYWHRKGESVTVEAQS